MATDYSHLLPTDAGSLSTKALLVRLSISEFGNSTKDKAMSLATANAHNATVDMVRVMKSVIPPAVFAPIATIRGQARAEHNSMTLPWSDDGTRVLPVTRNLEYSEAMDAHSVAFTHALNVLAVNWDDIREQARLSLGSLWSDTAFPSWAHVRSKFRFQVDVLPVPTSGDIRISGMSHDQLDAITASVERTVRASVAGAYADVYRRLFAVVSKAAETFADPKKIFRDSTMDNIRDAIREAGQFNVLDDGELTRILGEVSSLLAVPDVLRTDASARADVAARAAVVADQLAGFF